MILGIILCLGGIVSIQGYLLRNAFIQSEQTFDRNVQIVLHSVSNDLLFQNKKRVVEDRIDSTVVQTQKKIEILVKRKDSSNENVSVFQRNIVFKSDDTSHNLTRDVDSLISKEWTPDYIRKLIENSEYSDAHKQINRFDFESNIASQLEKLNLPSAFEFIVKDSKDSILKSSTQYTGQGKVYSKLLLSNNIFSAASTLYLILPQRNSSIFSKILFPLIVSIVFILTASLLFYYIFGLYKRQKRVSEARDDFINSMSHELKTPLATIALSLENINTNTASNSTYLSIIKEENLRMQYYIESILSLAQMEEIKFSVHKENVNLHNLLHDIVEKEAIRIGNSSGKINLNCPPDLIAKVDTIHFRNVIHNIVDNAIKYGDKVPIIEIMATHKSDHIVLSIRDNGKGIHAKHIDHIFTKFYRVQKGNIYGAKGTGIGLSYVKHIVDLHGGNIHVDSIVGVGSTFKIQLPNE